METYRTSDYDLGAACTTGEGVQGAAGPGRQEESSVTPAAGKIRLPGLDTGIASTSREGVKGPPEGTIHQHDRLDVAVTSPWLQQLSPPWNDVVKKGLKKGGPLKTTGPPRSQNKQAHMKREQRNSGIIGTATESNIGVVKTKLVNVFATKFAPSLDADKLRVYLSGKLENETVTCRKIESACSRYGSFHITAECINVADMYEPNLWPTGIYVHRFYEAHGPRFLNNEGGSELKCHGTPAAQRENMSA